MVDVDGVLVQGRPHDAQPWATSLEQDLGISPKVFHREFFAPYWNDVVVGKTALMEHLPSVLERIAPHLHPDEFVDYWFKQDSRLDLPLLRELEAIRAEGI